MARHTGPVLVDTNAILECFRVGCVARACRRLRRRDRRGMHDRDPDGLSSGGGRNSRLMRASFGHRSRRSIRLGTRNAPAWRSAPPISRWTWANDLCGRMRSREKTRGFFAGPTKPVCVSACGLGFAIGSWRWNRSWAIGHRPKLALRPAYTTQWLEKTLGELFIAEGLGAS